MQTILELEALAIEAIYGHRWDIALQHYRQILTLCDDTEEEVPVLAIIGLIQQVMDRQPVA